MAQQFRNNTANPTLKHIQYVFEAFGLCLLYLIFAVIPAKTASQFGGWLGRQIGKCISKKRMLDNLAIAFPDMSDTNKDKIISEMWDNLGRMLGEYPHLPYLAKHCTEFDADPSFYDDMKAQRPLLTFSAHQANWEIMPLAATYQTQSTASVVYRPPNNPYVRKLLSYARNKLPEVGLIPKGNEGSRQILAKLKKGENIGMLIDQKMSQGIAIPFFSQPAMTAPFLAQLVLKQNIPLYSSVTQRTKDGFHVIVRKFYFEGTGDMDQDVQDMMRAIHSVIEDWIKANPGHWLWLHRRWTDDVYQRVASK